MVGTRQFRETTEQGMAAFEPLGHQVDRIYDLSEPDMLIAEYHSDTTFPANGRRYSNHYLGIVRFSGDKISYWKEYINPMTVQEVMAP
jgi:ketosteroid isomerase-like protein